MLGIGSKTRTLLIAAFMAISFQAASANVYAPSLVEVIAAPSIFSFFFPLTIISVAVIAAIAVIETFVLRKLYPSLSVSGWRAFFYMFVINALTGMLGLFTIDLTRVYPRWEGFLVAYLASALIEWPMIRFLFWPFQRAWGKSLRASVACNSASYLVMLAVIAGMSFLPTISEKRLDRKELSGWLLVTHHFKTVSQVALPSATVSSRESEQGNLLFGNASGVFLLTNEHAQKKHGLLAIGGSDGKWRAYAERDRGILIDWGGSETRFKATGWPISASFSHDGKLLAYVSVEPAMIEEYQQYANGKVYLRTLAEERETFVSEGRRVDFHPTENKLAVISGDNEISIVDVQGGERQVIKERSGIFSNAAWSPDGRYLAYLSYPHNAMLVRRWTPILRITSCDGDRNCELPCAFFDAAADSRKWKNTVLWMSAGESTH